MPAFNPVPRPEHATLAGDFNQLKQKVTVLQQKIYDHDAYVDEQRKVIAEDMQRLSARITAGDTTGDRIMDYVLVRFGLHPRYYQRLARCQKAIMGHSGQLIVVSYHVATQLDERMLTLCRFVCGFLQDDQLILDHASNHGPYLPTGGKHMSEKRAPLPEDDVQQKMSLEPLDIYVAKAVALAGSEDDHVHIIVGTDKVRRWFKTYRDIRTYSVCVTALGRKDLALPDLKVL